MEVFVLVDTEVYIYNKDFVPAGYTILDSSIVPQDVKENLGMYYYVEDKFILKENYFINKEPTLEEQVKFLQQQLLETQQYIVDLEYQKLLQGGM